VKKDINKKRKGNGEIYSDVDMSQTIMNDFIGNYLKNVFVLNIPSIEHRPSTVARRNTTF